MLGSDNHTEGEHKVARSGKAGGIQRCDRQAPAGCPKDTRVQQTGRPYSRQERRSAPCTCECIPAELRGHLQAPWPRTQSVERLESALGGQMLATSTCVVSPGLRSTYTNPLAGWRWPPTQHCRTTRWAEEHCWQSICYGEPQLRRPWAAACWKLLVCTAGLHSTAPVPYAAKPPQGS